MPVDLPEGYTWRRATPADAEEIFALLTRYNTEVLGFADRTLDDVRSDLIEPGFAPATDSWLVHEPGGRLTGFGWAIGKGTGEEADVDVISRDPAVARGRGIATYLLRTAFRNDVAAGRAGTLLHVDTNNTTPALGLYESVGMRPVLVIDVWRRRSV